MGIILGDDSDGKRVGVAPGAQWIGVKLFTNDGKTYESWIHDALQWVVAPNGDPALAPDIVNNSWGGLPAGDDRFRSDLATLQAAGILAIFSAGNDGPAKSTMNNPGSYPEALAVGAVDSDKKIAHFSSRGPSPWDETKPEIVAPGVDIISSFPGGGYARNNGTSAAAPHVTGVAALLLQADPNLTPHEIEMILTSMAEPLGDNLPNNITGWGLIDAYAAGLQVTASGEIIGKVTSPGDVLIPYPQLSAISRDGRQQVDVTGDVGGYYSFALKPGLYDVTARAFGFEPQTTYGLNVLTGTVTQSDFALISLPVGSIFGQVTDSDTGIPLSATISVEGTPLQIQSNPNSGAYSLAVPEGTWSIRIVADAHRVGHITPTVTAGEGSLIDIPLQSGPRILLVDSGRWYYESQISYFEQALDTLDYPYRLMSIRDPFGQWGGPSDRPTTSTLEAYDLVIWSAPLDSPGLIDVQEVISGYLGGGGSLILSGQEIAFWDGGGTVLKPWRKYFVNQIGVWYQDEGELGALTGIDGSPIEGIQLELNTQDSARQQDHPDRVRIDNPLSTHPIFEQPDEGIAGVVANTCKPFRAAYLGFGLEGVGPQSVRVETFQRLLDWFATPPTPYDLMVPDIQDPLIGLPGTQIYQSIPIENIGVNWDTYDLKIEGGVWPLDLQLPDGRQVSGDTSFSLEGCAGGVITATISIPSDMPRDTHSDYLLRFISQSEPSTQDVVTLTAKTPAPLLFVDDERWYHYEDYYYESLDSLGYSYDVYNTQGGIQSPITETLTRYPLVLWTIGYDWFSPLTAEDESRLSAFLDKGGRLLLSSQDLLDIVGVDDFVRNRLGVEFALLTVTSTQVVGVQDSQLGTQLGPWDMDYPFDNWSDAVAPSDDAYPVFHDENLLTIGVVRPAENWRTAFFPFPIEALDQSARRELLGRTLLWLSPLGESHLQTPTVAPEGSRIPITLTLGLAVPTAQTGLSARLPLPEEVAFVPGSMVGPWHYDSATHSLLWAGALSPDSPLVLRADLDLSPGIPDGMVLTFQAQLNAGDGLTLLADTSVRVDAPWITLAAGVTPSEIRLDGEAQFDINVSNRGFASASVYLTDTLPLGLELIPGTATWTHGSAYEGEDGLTWHGELPPGASVEINFSTIVTLPQPGARLINRVEVVEADNHYLAWATLAIPAKWYFPTIWR
jgi:uncharacterized repeat protein (TIGR01451 family)